MSKKLLAAVLALSLVMSLLFVPAAAATTFDDVAADHWASSSIERWADYGVLTGHGDGTFTPDVVMTRAEFAAMLVKMLGLTAKSEAKFTDVTDDHWAAEVISIAVKAGIINGVGDNKFDPDVPVSFEEAAVMMCRAFGLAKNTSGTDWSKESIEKLTSLGMIGEGADEHLQVGVECNRAVVAKLADTMVAEYVAEDRATPITGEVKGVVLVVKGAKAEIKDATLAAPVVAESASVTLTNTKADAVIVSGKDAAVTADEQSTVASVVLAGEAPKADIKGEVASVTVAEETKGAVIEAPKAADNAIVNNSGTEITVNGETVSNKADDTPNNPTDTANSGTTITSDHKHTWTYSEQTKDATWTHKKTCSGYNENPKLAKCLVKPVTENCTITYVVSGDKHVKKCSVCGQADAAEAHDFGTTGICICGAKATIKGGNNTAATCEHTFAAIAADATADKTAAGVTAATCTTDGVAGEKCSKCGAYRTWAIPATGHNYGAVVYEAPQGVTVPAGVTLVAPTCVKAGTGIKVCSVENCKHVEVVNEAAKGHSYGNQPTATVEATCQKAGSKTYTCERQGCTAQTAGHTKTEVIPVVDHVAKVANDATVVEHSATQHWNVCQWCGAKMNIASHTWGDWTQNGNRTCSGCDATQNCNHNWSAWTDGQNGAKTRTCSICEMVDTCTHNGDKTCVFKADGSHSVTCVKCGKGLDDGTCEAEANTYQTSDTQHWTVCKDCGHEMADSRGNHEWVAGKCNTCQKPITDAAKAECANTHKPGATETTCEKCGVKIPAASTPGNT